MRICCKRKEKALATQKYFLSGASATLILLHVIPSLSRIVRFISSLSDSEDSKKLFPPPPPPSLLFPFS